MPGQRQIAAAKQLLVEGRDAEKFLQALIKTIGRDDLQVQNYGGVDELQGFLKALVRTREFREKVNSLGIIRDAERDPAAAFQSVCGALRNVGLPMPPRPETAAGRTLQVSVLILPRADQPGMLETICLEAVADQPVMKCVEEYFACIQKTGGSLPANLEKAKVHAFLSSLERPHLTFGQSAEAGSWPFASPVFDPLKSFLRAL
ncbi:hypothetical protein HUU40_27345 [candidate division KSB1 bacterium]|nr:hypothetical protein [candidate division KSB1 bacterium]